MRKEYLEGGESVSMYYRMDGTPYPDGSEGTMEWAKDFENFELRRIGHDKLENGLEISTVWLGLDHSFGGSGRPLIFETMVFVPQHREVGFLGRKLIFDREEFNMQRYSTLEEARLGHKMMVKRCKSLKSIEQILKK